MLSGRSEPGAECRGLSVFRSCFAMLGKEKLGVDFQLFGGTISLFWGREFDSLEVRGCHFRPPVDTEDDMVPIAFEVISRRFPFPCKGTSC